MKKNLLLSLLFIGLSGCAAQPLKVDVSQTIYDARVPSMAKPKVSEITLINKADDGEMVNTALGSDSVFPIKTEKATKETVEKDLRRYLHERTARSSEAKKSLRVVIHKADSYWVWSSAAKAPIFGLAFIGADTDFGLNLRISFEVEEGGKVISTYWFDDVITIQAKSTTQEAIKKSYKELVGEYRKTLFGDLDSEFVGRYL